MLNYRYDTLISEVVVYTEKINHKIVVNFSGKIFYVIKVENYATFIHDLVSVTVPKSTKNINFMNNF